MYLLFCCFCTGTFVYKQMETGMKAHGEMEIRTAMESSITLAQGSFMRAFGWMGMQNVVPCLILGEKKHPNLQNIRFHR